MNLLFEAKYALRRLRKTPGFTATGVAIVGFSLVIALVVFNIVYRFWIEPLDFEGSRNWYMAEIYNPETDGYSAFSIDRYTYARISDSHFDGVDKVSVLQVAPGALSDGDSSIPLNTIYIHPDLLQTAARAPYLGRLFQSDENQQDVMLSYNAWKNYYGANPSIIGQLTRINGQPRTIVGVLPKGFSLVFAADVWLPFVDTVVDHPDRDILLAPVLRLKQGAELKNVQLQLDQLNEHLREEFPQFYSTYSAQQQLRLVPLNIAVNTGGISIYIVSTTVAILLTGLGIFNMGSLFSVRVMERARELAIRNAIGGSQLRTVLQSSLENLITCMAGWFVGVGLASLTFKIINPVLQATISSQGFGFPDRWIFRIDASSIVFSLFACIVIWICSSAAPAMLNLKQDIAATLASGYKGGNGAKNSAAASLLVSAQTILACFVLIISGTLVVIMNSAIHEDYGVDSNNLVTANVNLAGFYQDQEQRLDYLQRLQSEFAKANAVQETAFTASLPGHPALFYNYEVEDHPSTGDSVPQPQTVTSITNNYFSATNVTLKAGRAFDGTDTADSLPVVIVDERFAQLYWQGDNALGKRIHINGEGPSEWLTIVGISSHVGTASKLVVNDKFWLYRPVQQFVPSELWMVARIKGDLATAREQILTAAARVNRDLPFTRFDPLQTHHVKAGGGVDIIAWLFTAVAAITLLLAITGIFGVLQRSIVARTTEIGVRRALGSKESKIVWLFLRKGIVFLCVGSVVGSVLALLMLNAIFGQTQGESSAFVWTITASVIACLALCILTASFVPARRAVRLEPGEALHQI